jgi:hypothetical protein
MFWSGYDADTNRRLLTDTGFDLIEATVLSQMEGDEEVRFQWITARAAVAEELGVDVARDISGGRS